MAATRKRRERTLSLWRPFTALLWYGCRTTWVDSPAPLSRPRSFVCRALQVATPSSSASLASSSHPTRLFTRSKSPHRMQTVRFVPGNESAAATKALDAVALAVAKGKRTVLLVGAGISTNAGIPVRALQRLYQYIADATAPCRTFARLERASTRLGPPPHRHPSLRLR